MTLALDVRGLEFSYPDGRQALGGVDLAVESGTRMAILGPNGAGKTTLALHLNGILRGSGSVAVGGLELTDDNHSSDRLDRLSIDAEGRIVVYTFTETRDTLGYWRREGSGERYTISRVQFDISRR